MTNGPADPASDAALFGQMVKAARDRLGWTQESVAEEALLNRDRKGYVSQVEMGKIPNLTRHTVRKIALALGIPRDKVPESLRWPEATLARAPVDTADRRLTEFQSSITEYHASIATQFSDYVPGSSLTLSSLYVPLRVKYNDTWGRIHPRIKAALKSDYYVRDEDRFTIVDSAASAISDWIADGGQKSDALRILRGGPGSGKSSFAKFLVHETVKQRTESTHGVIVQSVILIPMHRMTAESLSLEDSINMFIRDHVGRNLTINSIIDTHHIGEKLLIIFDGLDELSNGEDNAWHTSVRFLRQLVRMVDHINVLSSRILVLAIGRDVVVHEIEKELSLAPHQVLKLLPYSFEDTSSVNVVGDVEKDQRRTWWRRWLSARRLQSAPFPERLLHSPLSELSVEPLLLYMICNTGVHEGETEVLNRNELCELMIRRVITNWHRRAGSEPISFEVNARIMSALEVIAFAAWIDGGRSTSGRRIKELISSGYVNYIDAPTVLNISGIVEAILAFYVEPSVSFEHIGMEFSHKTFAEYLAGKYIYRSIHEIFSSSADAAGMASSAFAGSLATGSLSNEMGDILAAMVAERRDDGLYWEERWKALVPSLVEVTQQSGLRQRARASGGNNDLARRIRTIAGNALWSALREELHGDEALY